MEVGCLDDRSDDTVLHVPGSTYTTKGALPAKTLSLTTFALIIAFRPPVSSMWL